MVDDVIVLVDRVGHEEPGQRDGGRVGPARGGQPYRPDADLERVGVVDEVPVVGEVGEGGERMWCGQRLDPEDQHERASGH